MQGLTFRLPPFPSPPSGTLNSPSCQRYSWACYLTHRIFFLLVCEIMILLSFGIAWKGKEFGGLGLYMHGRQCKCSFASDLEHIINQNSECTKNHASSQQPPECQRDRTKIRIGDECEDYGKQIPNRRHNGAPNSQ